MSRLSTPGRASRIGLGLLLGAIWAPVAAAEPEARTVYLVPATGERIAIADLEITGTRYTLRMRPEPFTDHFLSMRPFKCIEGPEKHWCHVPYPYELGRTLDGGFTDLEYDLLFLWKGAQDYGIDMWNGVYYRLHAAADGTIAGDLYEMDMDTLAVPPEPGNLRPIRDVDLEPGDPESHWLPELVIE